MVHSDAPERAVRAYAWQLVEAAQGLARDGLIESPRPLITASGSAWYDLVADVFRGARQGPGGRYRRLRRLPSLPDLRQVARICRVDERLEVVEMMQTCF